MQPEYAQAAAFCADADNDRWVWRRLYVFWIHVESTE